MTGVVIDVGKSGIRCWFDGVLASVDGMAPDAAAAADAGSLLADGVRAAWCEHPASATAGDVGVVAFGTNFLPLEAELDVAGSALRAVWPGAAIAIAEDGILAHASALGRAGVVASVGTGTIVVGIDHAGRVSRVDGWGPDLGDRGSAWAIGVAGMRAVYRQLDGTGPATTLTADLADYLRSDVDLATATRLLARPDRIRYVAGFAVRVLRASAAGDDLARSIVEGAVDDLTASICAATRRIGDRKIALVGGLTSDDHWLSIMKNRCVDSDLDFQTPGSLRDLDAGVMVREPYNSACAWTYLPTGSTE
jgi:glucosamine kinase